MIEAKFFTVGTYLYKYNLTVLFVSPSKIAHDKFYIYCPPLLLNEMYAHDAYNCNFMQLHWKWMTSGLLFVRMEETALLLSFKTSCNSFRVDPLLLDIAGLGPN